MCSTIELSRIIFLFMKAHNGMISPFHFFCLFQILIHFNQIKHGIYCSDTFKTTFVYHTALAALIPSKLHIEFSLTSIKKHVLRFLQGTRFLRSFLYLGQALDLLVTVSSIHYCTSTSVLSTSSSSRGLTCFHGISLLGGGFTLRCLQRLSLPNLATLLCRWYDNRFTSGSSSPVLSY